MKTKRKVLSKKARFNIFKHDNFTCQYCGRSAPDVKLHIDHIIPLSKGGKDDITNFITACEDCNLGKETTLINTTEVPLLKSRYVSAAEQEALNEFRATYSEQFLDWIPSSVKPNKEIECWIAGVSTLFTFDKELTYLDPPVIYPFEIPMVTYNPSKRRWERDESWYSHLGYGAPMDSFCCREYEEEIYDDGNIEILYSLDNDEKYYHVLKINIMAYHPYPSSFWREITV